MARNEYGFALPLSPTITVGGIEYSLLIQFADYPTLGTAQTIVSGQISKVLDLGGGYKKVHCARGIRKYSVTHVVPDGSWEEIVDCICGGNIAASPEPTHLPWCYIDPESQSGPKFQNRAQVMDAIWVFGKPYLIIATEAFATPPDVINWDEEVLHKNSYFVSGVTSDGTTETYHGLYLDAKSNEGTSILIIPDESGLFDDICLSYIAGEISIPMTRKIWNNDADYLPEDAKLACGEYWIDLIRGRILLPSLDASPWDEVESVTATWYAQGLGEVELNSAKDYVLQGVGDSEDYCGFVFTTINRPVSFEAHSQCIYIKAQQDGDGKRNGLMWRQTLASNSPFMAISVESDGTLTVRHRDIEGGSIITDIDSVDPEQIIGLVLQENAQGFITAYYKVGDGEWTEFETIELDLTWVYWGGIFAFRNGGAKFSVATTGDYANLWIGNNESPGMLSVKVDTLYEPFNGEWNWTHVKDYDSEIVSVYNDTGEFEMNLGTSLCRNTYQVYGDNIIFADESFGDNIHIEYGGVQMSVPPGRTPPASGLLNFSADGGDPDENRGNWHDDLIVYDPADTLPTSNGILFDVKRNVYADPRAPFTLYYDEFNNELTDWTEIDSSNYYIDSISGTVLIKKDFVDANFTRGKWCFKAECTRIFKLNSVSPRYLNDLEKMIQVSNTFLADVGGEGEAFYAAGIYNCGASSFDYSTNQHLWLGKYMYRTIGKGATWGLNKGYQCYYSTASWGSGFTDGNKFWDWVNPLGPPFGWYGTTSNTRLFLYNGNPPMRADSQYEFGGLHWYDSPSEANGSISSLGYDGGDDEEGGYQKWIAGDLYVAGEMGFFYMNSELLGYNAVGCDGIGSAAPFINMEPIPFNPIGALKRLPKGTIINNAWLEYEFDTPTRGEMSVFNKIDTEAKVVKQWVKYNDSEWVYEPCPIMQFVPGVSEHLSFALMKRRRDSRGWKQVPDGELIPYGHEYAFVGQGIEVGSSAEHGIVDVAGAIQGIIDDADSNYADYFWFPSVGSGLIGAGAEGVGAFLKSLLPTLGAEEGRTDPDDEMSYGIWPRLGINMDTAEGVPMVVQTWDSIDLISLIINFTLPSGIIEKIIIPFTGNALIEKE